MDNNYNPLFDPKTDNLPVDPVVQAQVINDPKNDPAGLSEEDQTFLFDTETKIEQKIINLLSPDSLINHAVYDKLTEESQGKSDFNATNILASIRQIHGLWQINKRETFQIKNLVNQVRLTKERVEKEIGDVYII